MLIWRHSAYASLDGAGGNQASARWHTKGRPITYCASTSSGALLETIAHLKAKAALIPPRLRYLAIDLPDEIEREELDVDALPDDWRYREPVTQRVGDAWLHSARTAVLMVPSVLTPETTNFLLNPRHPQASIITISRTIDFPLDPRLVVHRA